MSKPNLVTAPWAAAIAVGTARDKAHGQLATNTETNTVHALLESTYIQIADDRKALNNKRLTKYPAHFSARLTISGLACNA